MFQDLSDVRKHFFKDFLSVFGITALSFCCDTKL